MELACEKVAKLLAVALVGLAFGACGPASDPDSGPAPGDASAPDARQGRDPTAATDLGGAQAAVDGSADGGASAAMDAAAPLDGSAAPMADPTAAIQVAPIVWQACADRRLGDDCARVKVPLDHAQPGGRQIELLVGRVRATDPGRKIGSLFINPGGPGAAGVTSGFLAGLASVLEPQMRARFDVVSWDPRGVPGSSAVDCKATPAFPALATAYDHSAKTTDRDALVAAYARWVGQCKAGAGDLLPFVGTSATVSDLELLRRAVGDPKLNYLGLSYGSDIGLHYHARYPDRVRALVIDGVESIWPEDFADGDQDQAFDAALTAFLDWCGRAAARCPFAAATASKAAAFDALALALAARPVPAGNGRLLGVGIFKWGVTNFLYRQDSWPFLAMALEAARTGNGEPLLASAQGYLGQGSEQDPSQAIDCGDHGPLSTKEVDDYAARHGALRIVLPYVRLACVGWPASNLTVAPPSPTAAALPPIVLIGSTGDPATPYKWATAVKARLSSSTLLTFESYTHTAYTEGNACIVDPVNAYFLDGTVPAAGIRCRANQPSAALDSKLLELPRRPRQRGLP